MRYIERIVVLLAVAALAAVLVISRQPTTALEGGTGAPAADEPLPPAAAAQTGSQIRTPPVPATSSDQRPERVPATALTATATRGCAWTPPVPATASVYGSSCFVPTSVPAEPSITPLLEPGELLELPWQIRQAAGTAQAHSATECKHAMILTLPPQIHDQVCPRPD